MVGGLLVQGRGDVRIDVKGQSYGGVTQQILHHLWVNASGQKEAGSSVPKIMGTVCQQAGRFK